GITGAKEMVKVLHKEHGFPLYPYQNLSYFRNAFPDLVPDFRGEKTDAAYAEAEALLEAIQDAPEKAYRQVAAELGYGTQRANELITLIRRRWPEKLPADPAERYTREDRRALEQAVKDAPLNASCDEVLRILNTEHPEFAERHPYASPAS